MKATKIKCVVDVDESVIIPIDKIALIEAENKRVYLLDGFYNHWYELSDEQFDALIRELELIGGQFID